MADVNADQIGYWNETAGRTWAQLQDRLDQQLEPLGVAAMTAMALKPGERVLDVGCGCGQTTLALAKQGADVVGVDISEPMLAIAEGRLKGTGAKAICADAQTHAFEPHGFDAVFSRFGVMFFDDPPAAFTNIRKALKPGGRLAFVCWRPFPENLWMAAPMGAALPHLPPLPPPDPLAPGPFAFANPDRVRAILAAAGYSNVKLEPHDEKIGVGDLETSVSVALRIGPLGGALQEHPQAQASVITAVREALKPYETAKGVLAPSATWIVTARA